MKLFRISGLVLFLLTLVIFTGYLIYEEGSKDTAGPVFRCGEERIAASVGVTREELLKGVTALDNKDGDVTNTVLLEKMSPFSKPGERILTYVAFDSRNNVTKWERTLDYMDYSPPRFALSRPLVFQVGEQNIIQYMTASDCIDGDLTDKIRYEEPEDSFGQEEKSYQVKFLVTNSAGDTAYLPATVEFTYPDYTNRDEIPEIRLSEYLVYLKKGAVFDSGAYLKSVMLNGKEYVYRNGRLTQEEGSLGEVSVSSDVNTNLPGTYEVKYSLTTEKGFTGTVKLLVVVEE